MKKFVLSALTLASLLGLATGVRAEDGAMVAHIDQEFVAAGKTFSAGTYSFVPTLGFRFVAIRNIKERSTAMVLPMTFEGAAPEHAHLTLRRVEGVSYLSEIATPIGVYTLASRRVLTKLAKAREHDAVSSSGTN